MSKSEKFPWKREGYNDFREWYKYSKNSGGRNLGLNLKFMVLFLLAISFMTLSLFGLLKSNPSLDGTASDAAAHFTLFGAARQFKR